MAPDAGEELGSEEQGDEQENEEEQGRGQDQDQSQDEEQGDEQEDEGNYEDIDDVPIEPEPDDPEDPPPPNPAREKAKNLAGAEQAASALPATPPGQAAQPCPLKAHSFLLVKVAGEDDVGIADVAVKLVNGAGDVLLGKSRADGKVSFLGIPEGDYTIALPQHDQGAWKLGDASAVNPPPPDDPPAVWEVDAPAQTGDVTHVVEEGEAMPAIAQAYGFSPDYLWDHDGNADLKKSRTDLRTLVPGDTVTIPPRRARQEKRPAGKQHVVKLVGTPALLKLRLTVDGEPRAEQPFLLELEGATVRGTTDKDGNLSVPVDPRVAKATLEVGPAGASERYELVLAGLQPLSTVRGAQQRLDNLGYLDPPYEDEVGPATTDALQRFQTDVTIEVTGALDDATRGKLKTAHGEG